MHNILNHYDMNFNHHECTGMPENITFDPTSSRTMTLSWDPPVADSRDGTISRYNILCSSDEHMEFSLQQYNLATAQSVSMTGLNPFTNYNCCIATQTTNGNGPYRCDVGITLEDGKTYTWLISPCVLSWPACYLITQLFSCNCHWVLLLN